jgi:hypothetical protein
MQKGWIKLHRKIFENEIWLSEPFTKAQAWIDLFANANHADGSFTIRGIKVEVQRGQLGWSEVTMAKRWRWGRSRVRKFLGWLEEKGQIKQQKTKVTSIITVVKYGVYQGDTTESQKTIQQNPPKKPTKTMIKQAQYVSNDTTESQKTIHKQEYIYKNKNIIGKETLPRDIVRIISLFKDVNPAFGRWYGNKTQRSAVERLLKTHGEEQVCKVIAILPKTNTMAWVTTITTPQQLEDRWATLASQLVKIKNKAMGNKRKIL